MSVSIEERSLNFLVQVRSNIFAAWNVVRVRKFVLGWKGFAVYVFVKQMEMDYKLISSSIQNVNDDCRRWQPSLHYQPSNLDQLNILTLECSRERWIDSFEENFIQQTCCRSVPTRTRWILSICIIWIVIILIVVRVLSVIITRKIGRARQSSLWNTVRWALRRIHRRWGRRSSS